MREIYKSDGKQYNSEPAIISLTSWKKRINTAGKSIYGLMKMCPGFHIVLVLNTVEFPNMLYDMPKDIQLFVKNKCIEILWLNKDYKVFQKVLFTIDKYRNVPVISSDDDNYPKINYAKELYDEWSKTKDTFISYWGRPYKNTIHLGGNFTIFPPYAFGKYGLECLNDKVIDTREDDPYYTVLRTKMSGTKCRVLKRRVSDVIKYHDCIEPLQNIYRNRPKNWAIYRIEEALEEYEFNK